METAPAPPVEWLRDVSPARWVVERLQTFGVDVASVIPAGFEAYARVFHPVETGESRARGVAGERWSSIAARNGHTAHPRMQLHRIACPPGASLDPAVPGVSLGSLPVREREALIELLAGGTPSPPLCWFCVWDGFAELDHLGVAERVELPHRRYFLYHGPLRTALSFLPTASPPPRARSVWYSPEVVDRWKRSASPPPSSLVRWPQSRRSPNLWWPDDRSWFVATEVDFAWTYVGGSSALIERVLSHPVLEAMPAQLRDQPHAYGDATGVGGG